MAFKDILIEFRAKHDLSQANLADILGVSQCMVNKYEKEKHNPTARNKIIYENKMKEWESAKNV